MTDDDVINDVRRQIRHKNEQGAWSILDVDNLAAKQLEHWHKEQNMIWNDEGASRCETLDSTLVGQT